MATTAVAALEVEQPSASGAGAAGDHDVWKHDPAPPRRSRRHDTFPRWFRMSAKLAFLILLLALPALWLRDPSVEKGHRANPKFAILFLLLGTLALPMWIPHVGSLVITFTAALPIIYAAIWISYGMFLAWNNIIFLQIVVVVVTFGLFFLGELFGVPTTLSGVFVSLYAVATCHYLMTPRMAQTLAIVLTAALALAAVLVTIVFSIVFPEYCTDVVWRGHHEGLEHLLHMAHHTVNSKPPRLMERGQRSEARRFLSSKSARRALLALGDNAPFAGPPPAAGEPSITIDAGGKSEAPDDSESDSDSDDGLARTLSRSVRGGRPAKRAQRAAAGAPPAPRLTGLQKAERSYNRMLVAMQVGAGAVMGSRAELVLGFCGTTRPVIPWFPLLPGNKCRPDPLLLRALRADATATALALYKLQAALAGVAPGATPILKQVEADSGATWLSFRAALLAALQEIVDAFPQDYYPPPRALDDSAVASLESQATELAGAWRRLLGGGGAKGLSDQERLQATLALSQVSDTAAEVRRLHATAGAAMEGLSRAVYGFMGCPCCKAES